MVHTVRLLKSSLWLLLACYYLTPRNSIVGEELCWRTKSIWPRFTLQQHIPLFQGIQ